MLEDLQRQIRSLRNVTTQELSRRTREAETIGTALGSVTRSRHAAGHATVAGNRAELSGTTESENSTNSPSLLRQRATAALHRIRRVSGSRGPTAGTRRSAQAHMTRRTAARTATSSSVSRSVGKPTSSSSSALSLRSAARRTRAQTQLESQIRASIRAMEMSPDLSRQLNNPVSESRARASQEVMERTEESSAANANRNELRAFSRRLELTLRVRREEDDTGTASNETYEQLLPRTEREELLAAIPRPERNQEYNQRFRHLLFGTPEYAMAAPSPPLSDGGQNEEEENNEERPVAANATRRRRRREGDLPSLPSRPWNLVSGGNNGPPSSRLRLWSEEPSSGSEMSLDSDSDNDPLALVPGGEGRDIYGFRRSYLPLRRHPWPPSATIGYESVRDYLNSTNASATSASRNENTAAETTPSRNRFQRNDNSRLSVRERLDARASLRRDAERERRQLRRERDISRRRRYERYMADYYASDPSSVGRGNNSQQGPLSAGGFPRATAGRNNEASASATPAEAAANDASNSGSSSGGLPPLRELIWRRMRRRNAQLNMLDDEIGAAADSGNDGGEASRERARHRELLSWMVDQLTIDHVRNVIQVNLD